MLTGDPDNITSEIHYSGNFVYDGAELSYILTSEGRITKEEEDFQYEYFLRDYLGNVRVIFTDDGNGNAEILQEQHYYPYGLTMGRLNYNYGTMDNKYLYQGKELQDDHNLQWYDFGARMFDSQIGRWHCADPALQHASPYLAMNNNPVNTIDPDGKWAWGGPMFMYASIVNAQMGLNARATAYHDYLDYLYGRGYYGAFDPAVGFKITWVPGSGGGGGSGMVTGGGGKGDGGIYFETESGSIITTNPDLTLGYDGPGDYDYYCNWEGKEGGIYSRNISSFGEYMYHFSYALTGKSYRGNYDPNAGYDPNGWQDVNWNGQEGETIITLYGENYAIPNSMNVNKIIKRIVKERTNKISFKDAMLTIWRGTEEQSATYKGPYKGFFKGLGIGGPTGFIPHEGVFHMNDFLEWYYNNPEEAQKMQMWWYNYLKKF